jgi:hypothetical protein
MSDDLDRAIQEARKVLREAEGAKEAADTARDAARFTAFFAAHVDLVSRSVGLRRALLELHCPKGEFPYDPDCKECPGGRWADQPFPCPTYILARDWEDAND